MAGTVTQSKAYRIEWSIEPFAPYEISRINFAISVFTKIGGIFSSSPRATEPITTGFSRQYANGQWRGFHDGIIGPFEMDVLSEGIVAIHVSPYDVSPLGRYPIVKYSMRYHGTVGGVPGQWWGFAQAAPIISIPLPGEWVAQTTL